MEPNIRPKINRGRDKNEVDCASLVTEHDERAFPKNLEQVFRDPGPDPGSRF
jgi:hypothetical protein